MRQEKVSRVKHKKNGYLHSICLLTILFYTTGMNADIGSNTAVQRFDTLQTVTNDSILGFAAIAGGFTLSTPGPNIGVFDSFFPVIGPVSLNGQTLRLNQDLIFHDVSTLMSAGTIWGNNHTVQASDSMDFITAEPLSGMLTFSSLNYELNADATIQNNILFTGANLLQGNGSVLQLASGNSISIGTLGSPATLNMTNLTLKGLGTGGSIFFGDPASQLTLNNVTVDLDGNYTTTQGLVTVQGPGTVIVKNNTWTFSNSSLLTINGVTLWQDQAGAPTQGAVLGNITYLNQGTTCDTVCAAIVDALQTSTGFLQSQIDSLTSCSICSIIDCLEINVAILIDEVEQLMSCCDVLSSKVDVCCSSTAVGPTNECTINVSGTYYWTAANIPATNTSVIFQFDPCYGEMCGPNPPKPTVVFDPAVFGNGGVVPIPASTRTIFSGEGIVQVRNGVTFDFQGTPFTDMSDWPALIIEDLAQMDFDSGSTITFGGQGGKFVVRSGALMNMDVPTHVIFGQNLFATNILHWIDFAGSVLINNPSALLTYSQGTFDILYSNHSTLNIQSGTMEVNTLNGAQSDGILSLFHFVDGSSLRIDKTGVPSVDGLLRFAPNFLNATIDFDNRAGITFLGDGQDTGGNIQFVSFDNPAVNTTTIIQDKHFAFVRPMVELFMELSYYLYRGLIETPDATIMCRMGTIPVVANDGQLAAFCPTRDGSIVGLQQGDHDLFYDGLQIKGYNFANQLFTISNCDASTRVGG
jgi:hypothetical protein